MIKAPRPHKLSLIAAVDRRGGIGRDNSLLVSLPADLQHFRQCTQGCPVIMGRKTWDSLPPRFRPLPGRRNVVLSRQPDLALPGAEVVPDLPAALALLRDAPQAWVIGGAQLYAQALPLADELVLTEIDAEYPADAFFPAWDQRDFDEKQREPHPADDFGRPAFAFVTHARRRPPRP